MVDRIDAESAARNTYPASLSAAERAAFDAGIPVVWGEGFAGVRASLARPAADIAADAREQGRADIADLLISESIERELRAERARAEDAERAAERERAEDAERARIAQSVGAYVEDLSDMDDDDWDW